MAISEHPAVGRHLFGERHDLWLLQCGNQMSDCQSVFYHALILAEQNSYLFTLHKWCTVDF